MPLRPFALVVVCALVAGMSFAQTDAPEADTPKFDIADVHVSAPPANLRISMTGGVLRGGRYDLRKATMVDLIRTAYDVAPDTIEGGPSWLEMDRFDISAKAPPSTSSASVKLMLQSLLAERFGLVMHKDAKPMPAYIMKVSGKSKLKEGAAGGVAGCQPVQPAGPTAPIVVTCHNEPLDDFAKLLRGPLATPVVDSTGLKGGWDFEIRFYDRSQIPLVGAGAVTLIDALDQQLGLKLDLGKTPAPVLVVDRVNETPTPNSPGVAQALPPLPLEFEVADIKLSTPDEMFVARPMPGGRVELRAVTLKQMIELGYGFFGDDDRVVGATKGVESTKFDVIAKTSSVLGVQQFDEDDIEAMERTLLADRFKLKAHMEERPFPAYTLTAVKPKLTKADPSNRTGCKEAAAVAKDPRDTDPARSRLVTCRNMTMAQFAEQLQRFAGGYIRNPVLDSTGIEGNYDITLSFSTVFFIQNSGRSAAPSDGAPSGGTPTAADPSGGLSLFDAVSKQLGLKLEMQKRPVPVLVIDSVLEKPTDN